MTCRTVLSWSLFKIGNLVVMVRRVELLLIAVIVVIVMDGFSRVSWHSVLHRFLKFANWSWTLTVYDLSLITIGSIWRASWLLIMQNFLPEWITGYIYESSRWCLRMRKGVLLVIVVFVWFTLGVSCLLAFNKLLILNIIPIQMQTFINCDCDSYAC